MVIVVVCGPQGGQVIDVKVAVTVCGQLKVGQPPFAQGFGLTDVTGKTVTVLLMQGMQAHTAVAVGLNVVVVVVVGIILVVVKGETGHCCGQGAQRQTAV